MPLFDTAAPRSADPVLEVIDLSKRFRIHARQRDIVAFDGLRFDVRPGEMTALVGAAGAGKSSALKCIYRTYRMDRGSVRYRMANGASLDLATASDEAVLALRGREIRYASQFLHVLPRKTAVEVVARPLRALGHDPGDSLEAARHLLRGVDLPRRLWDVPPATFSGGERQLVNLARAIIVEPRLLLLDEPTASLDGRSKENVARRIEDLKAAGVAVVAVFHDQEMVARLAEHRVEMPGGIRPDGDDGDTMR